MFSAVPPPPGTPTSSGMNSGSYPKPFAAKDVCREHDISSATFYAWKSKFGGMEASDIKRMRDLEHENARLKQMYVDLSLENRPLKDVIEKKL